MAPSDIGNNAERCDDCDCDKSAGDIAPSIVPNLGPARVGAPGLTDAERRALGQVIIVGGSPPVAPPPPPPPVAPAKIVPPEQLEEYLNKWNNPETRSAGEEFSFPWLRAKITSIIKDFLS